MKFHTPFLVAAITIFPATASYADVTPQEVWDHAQLYGKTMGQTLNARLEQDGDTLIVHDVTIKMPGLSNDFMMFEGSVPKIILKQLDDGKVEMTTPEPIAYSFAISGNPKVGMEPVDILSSMTIDNTIIVSGSAGDFAYEMLPGTMTYVTQKQIKDGIAVVPEQIVTALGVHGLMTYSIEGDNIATVMDVQADAVTAVSNGTTESMTMETTYKAAPLKVTANFTTSASALDEPLGYLKTLNGDASYSIDNLTAEMTTGAAAQMMHMVAETQGTSIGANIANGSFNYFGSSIQTEVVLDGSAIPFPQLDFGIGNAEFAVTMPFLASDDPETFGLKLALENLRLPEIAWMMIDPTGQMAHDPAALKFDISGDMMLDVDLTNPQDMMDLSDDKMPLFPTDLALNELFLSIAGATLSGTGNATFIDRDDVKEAQLPLKTGQATLALTGGTALIDTLSQTGLIPPQMSASAQMMLSMFARPGETADSYITDIELNEQGALTINGQPMPF